MDDTRPLLGSTVLEVGAGAGASTAALAEQGVDVIAVDLSTDLLAEARLLLDAMALSAELVVRNATELASVLPERSIDQVVFWAVLEHMTIEERLVALREAWTRLEPGGLLTVVETPNRLWPFDSHTSQLPFFSWLPYELAYRYAGFSPRVGFGDQYGVGSDLRMEPFLRRGHGVSFHEFDLAVGDHKVIGVKSCMQTYRRREDLLRWIAWSASRHGHTERVIASYSPGTDRAWFQPFLYLTLEKPDLSS